MFFAWLLFRLCSTLFPNTTLFRSRLLQRSVRAGVVALYRNVRSQGWRSPRRTGTSRVVFWTRPPPRLRSEEHTSEPQSRPHLVCRLLLEKKINLYRILLNSRTLSY